MSVLENPDVIFLQCNISHSKFSESIVRAQDDITMQSHGHLELSKSETTNVFLISFRTNIKCKVSIVKKKKKMRLVIPAKADMKHLESLGFPNDCSSPCKKCLRTLGCEEVMTMVIPDRAVPKLERCANTSTILQ